MESSACAPSPTCPRRNTSEQLERIHARPRYARDLGCDYQPAPPALLTCEELRRLEFADLNEATWALVAHEALLWILPAPAGPHGSPDLEALAERISRIPHPWVVRLPTARTPRSPP